MMGLVIVAAVLGSAAVSALAMPVSMRLARRWGMLDRPGEHRAHARPTPLLGGSAVLLALLTATGLALALAGLWRGDWPAWLPGEVAMHLAGVWHRAPQAAGILAGAVALHAMGLVDDRRRLGAAGKLAVQFVVAGAVVTLCGVRVLTLAGPAVSIPLTVLWIVAITNAINFMDNMDGLAGGVGVICAAGLLAAASGVGQWFVAGWACVLMGALLGFLPYNLPPARSFMGDNGSMVVGYFLAVLSVQTTYVRPAGADWTYGVFAPLVLLAVPIYDMLSVTVSRIRRGVSPFQADRGHFSHRLVGRGMRPTRALLTIWLCTACTVISAVLLTHVRTMGAAILVFAQAVVVVTVVGLLESGGTER